MTRETVQQSVTVPLPRELAYERFTAGLAEWWPREYTWAQAKLETIAIEPEEGGHCFELGPYGFRCDWGRVLAWEPPERLVFSWQISPTRAPEPDPENASEVEVTFASSGDDETDVTLRHRHFERHGEGGADYRKAMGSPQGWAWVLERFGSGATG